MKAINTGIFISVLGWWRGVMVSTLASINVVNRPGYYLDG